MPVGRITAICISIGLLVFSSSSYAQTKGYLSESVPKITCEESQKDCAGVCFGLAVTDCAGICGGDAILDDCGQCNGNNERKDCNGICDGPAIVDCNGVCNGGVEFDSCGECGGDATDCKACVYEVDLISNYAKVGSEILSGAGSELACIDTLFENLLENVDYYIESGLLTPTIKVYMNMQNNYMSRFKRFAESGGVSSKLRDGKTCGEHEEDQSHCITDDEGQKLYQLDDTVYYVFRQFYFIGVNQSLLGQNGHVVMDENCNPVAFNQDEQKICGKLEVRSTITPISLYWEPEGSFEVEDRLVNFALDPYSSNKWSTWRASGKLPLVVWDPDHTGKIDSATQLFGNWTFGGKNRQLAGLGETSGSPKTWGNGYEALGTLDSDGDGKVSGTELDPLGLWFDYNQNGVSEDGEVVSIKDAGVTELFYQHDHTDKDSQDLHLSNGFKREVNGEGVIGASVDWYGRSFKSYQEGLQLEKLGATMFGHNSAPRPKGSNEFIARPNPSLREPFLGLWKWTAHGEEFASIDQMNGVQIGGYLIFTRDKSGIKGITISEYGLKKNSDGAKSLVQATRLSGFVSGQTPMDAALNLKSNNERGETTFTKAAVDGSRMVGQSSVKLNRKNGTSLKLDYGWIAQRIPYSQLFRAKKQ